MKLLNKSNKNVVVKLPTSQQKFVVKVEQVNNYCNELSEQAIKKLVNKVINLSQQKVVVMHSEQATKVL